MNRDAKIGILKLEDYHILPCVGTAVGLLTSAGFKITNPNAKKTCGCGQSFS